MKRPITLKKNTFDIYAFNLLVLLTALILAWTNLFNRPTGDMDVKVYVATSQIDQLDLDEDIVVVYKMEDYPEFLGDITLEIADRKVRVEKETSPLHYCSIQGWVGTPGLPIICAPNYFMVVIEAMY